MKIHKLFYVMILLAVLLSLVAARPVSANPEKTPFRGTCNLLEEGPSPNVKMWYTDQNELHIRNRIQTLDCHFTDKRLDGVYIVTANWDVKEYQNPIWYVTGHDYGQMIMKDASGNVLWEGTRDSVWSYPMVNNGIIVLNGGGMYAGLTVMADEWGIWWNYPWYVNLSGEITE
jgi:hypothetical protein